MLRAKAMRLAGRRYESTAASKAQQGLSKVTSAAGPAIAGAARGVGNALGKIGGRTGRLINFVQGTSDEWWFFWGNWARIGCRLPPVARRNARRSEC